MNVVTIDFDIIMAPSIESYKKLMGDYCNYNDLEKRNSLMKFCPADLHTYNILTEYIISVISYLDKNNVKFIYNHDDVVSILQEKGIKHANLINIDHHHDLGYPPAEENNKDNMPLNCGTWAYICKKLSLVDEFTWIRNINSRLPCDLVKDSLDKEYIIQQEIKLVPYLNYLKENTDVLIICASFDWIPSMWRDLFFTWKIICDTNYNTIFEVK